MKPFIFLLLLGLHEVTSVTHSLKYFYTGSSGVPNFPEYVSVGMIDDVQISRCDSITKRNVPKQDWMKHISDDPQYWEKETLNCWFSQQNFKINIEIAKQRFNQTEGAHVFQRMYGCEWDDETVEVNGYDQYGYDGEDFISFDLKGEQWIAPRQQAVITKDTWNTNRGYIAQTKNYLTQHCPEWLKKYVNYGRSSLMRTGRVT
ncbi:H-2 class I histocompatibility antigen, K-K alpha chain-like [Parambassis ranga]|uniref:H-2 class I histocompatibility antigen, K-K alpha chain-like n=1 Tax=Parambassis ranga TaxID=210632 RepID=A0A6P7I7Q9_9TELE|nr:H-2 class I histocompatibility antigen, K-K alpha chain-like [Parambassis ranga]